MTPNRSRRGLSLIEVLIAFLILAVGVSSVIALFPIGVLSVQNAVNETKASMQAITAHGEVLANRWPDDQYLLAPPVQGVFGAQAAYLTPDPPAGAAAPLGGDPRGIHLGTTPPYVGTDPGRSLGTHPFLNNVFATVIRADGMAPPVPNGFNVAAPERFHPEAGAGAGFPVFVDPVLANARDFQFDPSPANCPMYKRVPIVQNLAMPGETFATMAPFTGALNDLVIHSLSEVQYQLAGSTIGGAPQLTSPSRRDQYLAQWFYSHDDLHFEESAATTPYNPSRLLQSPAVPGWRYVRSADSSDINTPQTLDPPGAAVLGGTASAASQNYATGSRTAAFSFAFVIKDRRLEPQPAGQTVAPLVVPTYPTGPSGVQPPYLVPRYGSYSPEQIQIMVFNKRTTMRGYHLVRACIYSGSSRATLSWDPAAGGSLPVIRRGMWLMEATLSPGLRDDTPGAGAGPAPLPTTSQLAASSPPSAPATAWIKYRHAIEFYRVSAAEDPKLDPATNQYYQAVTFEKPVQNYPIAHADGDNRRLPDSFDPANDPSPTYTFSGNAYPNVIDSTTSPNAITTGGTATVRSVWVPMIAWHGLQEVFTVRN